jgi:hypothetical protein
LESTVEVGEVELREELVVEVRREVAVGLGKEVDTEAEPIRVDTKLDTSGNWNRTGN